MSKKLFVRIPSIGRGRQIEVACLVMAAISIIGGILAAGAFGKTPISMYGSRSSGVEYSLALILAWFGSGLISAVFWFALSGIGSLLQWKEFNYLTKK